MFFDRVFASNGFEITVTAGLQQLSFSMFPGGTISGKILDPHRREGESVSVALLRMIYGDGGTVLLRNDQEVTTNAQGEYRISGASPGEYYVRAKRHVAVTADSTEDSDALVYFPGTADATRAETVLVASGQESRLPDIQLQTVSTVRLSGQILDPGPNPPKDLPEASTFIAARTTFFLMPQDPGFPRDLMLVPFQNVARDASNGHFEIRGVPKGSYYLFARIQVDSKHSVNTDLSPIDVRESDLGGVTLSVFPPTDLKVHIVIDREAATLLPKIREAHMNLSSVDRLADPEGTKVDAYGNLSFTSVSDGRYRLTSPTIYAESACVSDIRQGSRSVMDSGIVTVERGAAESVELRIQAVCGSVNGTVVGADGLPTRATVVLVPDAARRRNPGLYKATDSEPAGTFAISGIPAGTYKLFAWKVDPDGAWRTPAFLSRFESDGFIVIVKPGNSDEVQLRAIP
jgi:hypothetical protein